MTGKIKIGLVGCGRWGKNILRDLLALQCEVHVAEHKANHREFALGIGAASATDDWSSIPTGMDGYVVAVQTIHHFDIVQNLLRFQKPIYCEKPLTDSLAQARSLYEKGKALIFVMHKWRYHAAIVKMQQVIQSGDLGNVLSIDLKRKQWGQPHSDVDVSWILMPHDLSILLHLLGNLPKPVFASSIKSKEDPHWFHHIYAVLGDSPRCTIEVSECYMGNDRGVHVLMEKGAISMTDPLADFITVKKGNWQGESEELKIAIDNTMPLLEELKAFVGYLNKGNPPFTSIEGELAIIEAIEHIRDLAQ